MTKIFAFVAAIALAITFSSCASKEKSMDSGMSHSSTVSYAK